MSKPFPEMSAQQWLTRRWPTTILRDRYGGVYSGGEWTAFPLHPQDVPPAVADQDVPCREFWMQQKDGGGIPIGVGATPAEALERLETEVARLAGPELHEQVMTIHTRDDLVRFLERLADDLRENSDAWENPTLDRFLDALARWTSSMENVYRNTGRPVPQEPSWRTFGEMMLAARIYE